MEKSYLRGHEIEKIDGEWVFSDTKEPTVKTWHKRPCGYCGEYNTPEGHDGCLGTLPGVMNACCGHGQTNEAYVQFWDGFSVHGKDAITIMQILTNIKRDKGNRLIAFKVEDEDEVTTHDNQTTNR